MSSPAKEIDWLLLQAVKNIENHREQRFVKFVISIGYKDKPDVDEDGKPSPRRTTPVHQIARCRPLNLAIVVRQLFKLYDRFDVNYTDEFGLTHLHVACMTGCLEVVRKFLDFGHDPNCLEPETGDSPLHLALAHKRTEVAKLLLKSGANPNSLSDDKYRPLQINLQDNVGNTPLLWALFRRRINLFELLLRNGANPNIANADGLTPLQYICRKYHDDFLMEMLFDINEQIQQTVQIDSQDSWGRTALHLALTDTDVHKTRIIRGLMKRGANPNLADTHGSTPLHVICKRRYEDDYKLAEMFFELGDENYQPVQIDRQDEFGRTPLYLALCYNYVKTAELLLRRGANPNLANSEGLTALHIIFKEKFGLIEKFVTEGKLDLIEKLLLNTDPNVADADGSTLLHWICNRHCDNDLAKIFFKINKDKNQWVHVDAEDNFGRTPLQLAVKNLLPCTVDVLLNHGADLSSFVFPSESLIDKRISSRRRNGSKIVKLRLAARALGIVECFHNRGYELDQSGALLIMKYFAEHELFATSSDLEKRLCEDKDFASRAKKISIKPDLSLFDLVQLRPEKAQKLLLHTDYYKLTNSKKWSDFPKGLKKACEIHLSEKLSRGFFRRWAVYPFWEFIHYRLPLECCEMVLENLNNEDLYNIYLAATGRSS
ncbi:ankyrin-1-like [Trichogramma pretiosum]|uniref:ankyrin-1-like n=1 Tax=Trichogramma pretiosum TaxID=7493 RepID=UPI0006C9AA47|nr:ankyrin-1-like [Trichogramma pretiosum]